MNVKELPYLIRRRLTNQVRGGLLRYGLSRSRKFKVRFLFTCFAGIFLYDNGRIRRIVKHQHFGITAISNGTFAAARWITRSPMEKCAVFLHDFDGTKVTGTRQITFRDSDGKTLQPFGVHQIRMLNGYLWVTNTRENVVWKCTLDGDVLAEWTETDKMLFDESDPEAEVAIRKGTEDYKHYNSIAYHDGHYYIMVHNCTQRNLAPDKRSYIVKLDEDLQVVDRIVDVGRACHDLEFIGDSLFVCNSRDGILVKDFEPYVELNSFLRGVGHSENLMAIGGSQFEVQSSARESTTSKLYFIDLQEQRLLTTVELGRVGNIRDILFLE